MSAITVPIKYKICEREKRKYVYYMLPIPLFVKAKDKEYKYIPFLIGTAQPLSTIPQEMASKAGIAYKVPLSFKFQGLPGYVFSEPEWKGVQKGWRSESEHGILRLAQILENFAITSLPPTDDAPFGSFLLELKGNHKGTEL